MLGSRTVALPAIVPLIVVFGRRRDPVSQGHLRAAASTLLHDALLADTHH
jgi:hypothetical protein